MTATQHKPMQAPALSLNVKEQLEATATRFWTSVRMNNKDSDGGLVADGAIKVPGVPVGLFTKRSSISDDEAQNKTPCNQSSSLQFVLNSMFSSCTNGGQNFETDSNDGSVAMTPSALKQSSRSRTVATSIITPSSSRGETSAPGPITPSPLHQQKSASAVKVAIQESSKTIFKNNHEIAQEAIHRLRQQHKLDQSEKLVTNSLYESEVAVDTEREPSLLSTSRSLLSNNPSLLSMNPSTLTNNRSVLSSQQDSLQAKQQQVQLRKPSFKKFITPGSNKKTAKIPDAKMPTHNRQDHSFFPASKPKDGPGTTRQEKRLRKKLKRNKGVPKEVIPTSPIRMLKNRNTQRQKQLLNTTNSNQDNLFGSDFNIPEEKRDVIDSWDIENDGISDITQSTVDRMVLAISQHLRVFPEEADNLNRVHSDITDPVPIRGSLRHNNSAPSEQLFPMIGGDVAGFTNMTSPQRGGSPPKKSMSPAFFTRTKGSVGTRSFFTKTTHSTQTNDFANAWKIDEQNFWETEVANENEFKDLFWNNSAGANNGLQSPSRMMIAKKPKRSGAITTTSTITTAKTTPTTSFTSPQSPPLRLHRKHEDHTSQEMFLTDHGNVMDNLVLQNELEMAEI